MGQKVNPIGLRVGINRTWDSRWFAKGNAYTKLLGEDLNIKSFLKDKLRGAAVSRITVERPAKVARVTIYSARPGIIIGKNVYYKEYIDLVFTFKKKYIENYELK